MILGLANMSSFYQAPEEGKKQQEFEHKEVRQDKQQLEHEFNRKIDEVTKQVNEQTTTHKQKFYRLLKKERERGLPEKQCLVNVEQKLGYWSQQVNILEKEKQAKQLQESKEDRNRCSIRINKLKE